MVFVLLLTYELSGLSVNVGESQITQSLKVRDLGVTFDQKNGIRKVKKMRDRSAQKDIYQAH